MPDTIASMRSIQTVRCPACGTPVSYDAANPFRPFCSERCRLIDLGQWLEEDYRVAGDPAVPEVPEDA